MKTVRSLYAKDLHFGYLSDIFILIKVDHPDPLCYLQSKVKVIIDVWQDISQTKKCLKQPDFTKTLNNLGNCLSMYTRSFMMSLPLPMIVHTLKCATTPGARFGSVCFFNDTVRFVNGIVHFVSGTVRFLHCTVHFRGVVSVSGSVHKYM